MYIAVAFEPVNWPAIEKGDVIALLEVLDLIVYQGGDITGSNATAIYMQLNAPADAAYYTLSGSDRVL